MPVFQFRRLPPLFCLSIGAFLGVVLTALILVGRGEAKRSELVSNYGNALATLVAQDAVDPIVSNNLLSLHAIMSSIAALPRVHLASVYSTDQELLAQAGKPASTVSQQEFSASITLHDSVAGRVVISVDTDFGGDAIFYSVLSAVAVLLLLMGCLALFEVRAEVFAQPPLRVKREDLDEPLPLENSLESSLESSDTDTLLPEPLDVEASFGSDDDAPIEDDALVEDDADACYSTDLIVALPNFSILEKQLSDIVFSRRVVQFERQFRSVLSVYNGHQIESHAAHGIYFLRFQGQVTLVETVFSAICSAFLIQSLDKGNKIKFQYLAAVCAEESDIRLSESIRGVYVQAELINEFLTERLIFGGEEEGYVLVVAFREQYASLLEKQAEQLQPLS